MILPIAFGVWYIFPFIIISSLEITLQQNDTTGCIMVQIYPVTITKSKYEKRAKNRIKSKRRTRDTFNARTQNCDILNLVFSGC